MTRAIQVATAFAIALAANIASADTVFRSVDANGLVVFSDRPSVDLDNETIELAMRRTNTSQIKAKKTADEEIAEAAKIRESQQAEDQAAQDQILAQVASERQANCDAAKARQNKYNTNRKLYKPLPNGEREYLSDDQIDAARAEATRTVNEWCS